MYECFGCMYVGVLCACLVSTEIRRGCRSLWSWSYSWYTVWRLGTEPWSSVRATSALNCWTISVAPATIFNESNADSVDLRFRMSLSITSINTGTRIRLHKFWFLPSHFIKIKRPYSYRLRSPNELKFCKKKNLTYTNIPSLSNNHGLITHLSG